MHMRTSRCIGPALAAALLASSLAGTTGYAARQGAHQRAGGSITVLVPPWAALPKSLLAQFHKRTGITVNLQTLAWDQIHDKVVTAAAANVPVADVTEFDWSWVGQFGRGGWYTPLDKYLGASMVKDIPTSRIFTFNGSLLAMPYTNDFRLLIINRSYFKRAGIKSPPTTLAKLMADARKIKAKGIVKYPFGEPLSATEGAATPWYLLTKAYGGQLFSSGWKPAYGSSSSAGGMGLSFLYTALKQYHLIDPAEVAMTDVQTTNAFLAGKSAFIFTGPGTMSQAADPKLSRIVGRAEPVLMPGRSGPGPTFGLPEALGIPKSSKHVTEAVQFLKWWYTSPVMLAMYKTQGDLPTRTSVLDLLRKQGKLVGGASIVAESKRVTPLFPQGTPSWYPKFSGDVAAVINQMAKGEKSLKAALQALVSAGASAQS